MEINKKYFPVIIIFFSLFLFYVKLWQAPVRVWDDSQYCAVARYMVESGDVIHTSYEKYHIFYEKPPLVIWVTAIGLKFFGFNDFGARFGFALFSLITVIGLYYLLKKEVSPSFSFITCLLLLTTQQFLEFARRPMIDSLMGPIFIFAFLFYFKGRRKSLFYLVGGIFFGLSLLARGFMPFFIPLCVGTYILISREWRILKSPLFYLSWILGVLIALPWNILMYLKFKEVFVKEHLVSQYLKAFIGVSVQGVRDWNSPFEYIKKLLENYWPHLIVFCIGYYQLIRVFIKNKLKKEMDENKRFYLYIIVWFTLLFVVFHFSGLKVARYLTLLYPAMAIICAYPIVNAKLKVKNILTYSLIGLALLWCLMGVFTNFFPKYLDGYREHTFSEFLINNKKQFSKLNKNKVAGFLKKDWGYYFRILFYSGASVPIKKCTQSYEELREKYLLKNFSVIMTIKDYNTIKAKLRLKVLASDKNYCLVKQSL